MRNRWPRWRLRHVALFVVIAAVVAVVVVILGRELGVGRDTAAVSEDASEQATAEKAVEPLTLTLSGPDICETERGRGYSGEAWVYDDEGEIVGTRTISLGWANIAEIPVRWEVSGTGPYTLVIDNEHRDAFRPYGGTTDEASVSCALTPGEVSYNYADKHRWYHADPQVDSGLKTIRATVTDSNGATAVASHDIYVILQVVDSGTPMMAGETYRIHGFLFTIPIGVVARAGSFEEVEGVEGVEGSENSFGIAFFLDGHRAIVSIGRTSGTEIGDRRIEKLSRPSSTEQGQGAAQGERNDPEAALNSLITVFVESRGRVPSEDTP